METEEKTAQPSEDRSAHRGGLIYGLGIAAVAADFCCVLAPLGLVFGIIALVMGQRDLRRMRLGEMDASGEAKTKWGRTRGIIGIILAIALNSFLINTFYGAIHKSYRAVCMGNEKQLALAMMLYAEDNNGYLPGANDWSEKIHKYLEGKDSRLMHCVEDNSRQRSSYGMNVALSGKKLEDLENPSGVVLIYETAHPGQSPSGDSKDVVQTGRHNNGSHFAFADGHVRWYKEGEVPNFVPKWK
jgi:prepilin-type processing-associated H-X9-DG protein